MARDRKFIVDTLLNGLKRLEYRGYDSAGMAIDTDTTSNGTTEMAVIKKRGKVAALEETVKLQVLLFITPFMLDIFSCNF